MSRAGMPATPTICCAYYYYCLIFYFDIYFIQLLIRHFPNTNGTYLYNAQTSIAVSIYTIMKTA